MRTIEDLSQNELLQLDNDMCVVMIDRQCAKDGVPLLPSLRDAPVKPDVEPDVTAFEVRATLRFGRKEDADHIAMELATLQRFETDYLLGGWSGPKCIKILDPDARDDIRIDLQRFWSREKYDAHRVELQAYEAAKKEYDGEKKEYDDISKKRESAITYVGDLIYSAHEKHNLEKRIQAAFEKYKLLAGGDEEMALGFLIKAARWSEEDIRATLATEELIETTEEGEDHAEE